MHRLQRFVLFSSRFPGFTRWRRGKVQFPLDILPHFAVEIHVLLASPLVRAFNHRSRLSLSVDSAFRLWSASIALPTTWPTTPYADFCPAVRLPLDSLSREATQSRSPGVSSIAFCAQSPDLRSACLMDMGFAVRCPLALRSRLVSDFCPSTRAFAPRFLQTPPRDDAVALRYHFSSIRM